MNSLRVSLATASLLLLSASTLSAQGTRIACKDGSAPKAGHFTCWGHGGVVSAPLKKAKAAEHKAVAKTSVGKKSGAKKSSAKAAKKKAAKKAKSARG
jgi:hypothetical protein